LVKDPDLVRDEIEHSWTRGYADDYWNDPVSPLFFELLGDQLTQVVNVELNGIMGYSKPGDETDRLLLLYRNHAYFNLEILKRKVEYEIPPMLRNDDILNYFEDGTGAYGKETMKKQPFRLAKRVLAEIRVMLYDKNGSITKTATAYEKWSKKEFEPFYEKFDLRMQQLSNSGEISKYVELANELDRLMIGHFRLVRYGIPVHNIGMNLIAQYLLGRFLGKEEATATYPILLSGLNHKTSETNQALFRLASGIEAFPHLKSTIIETPSDRIFAKLRADKSQDAVRLTSELESFFKEFGVRGFTREPYYPRWQDAPQHVFNILKAIVREESLVPVELTIRNRDQETITEKEIATRVKSQSIGWVKWKLFSIILSFARKYIIFRENQRFNLDRWITMNRKIFIEIGKRLLNMGVLKEPSDIFFLRKSEIRGFARKDLSVNEIRRIQHAAEERKEEFLKNENLTPPKFLRGNCESEDLVLNVETMMQGIAASRGVLSGPVRVLDRIDDIWQVRSGEILVVPRTDPGWTPVFRKIGGLITETGGLLSHGAVVSREYGIPAVTNIPNACRIFRNGQYVTIDGSKGTVSIE
jgi:phosphohistidine swiveling domain-containing protein